MQEDWAFDAKGMLQSGLNTNAIKSAVPSNFRTSKWTGIAKEQELFISHLRGYRS